MKKINIKNLELNIEMTTFLDLKNAINKIIIDIDGNIYINEECPKNKVIVFSNENYEKNENIKDLKELANSLFDKYKPSVLGTICKIKPLNNWQKIIGMNRENMLYFDHPSDGIEIFEDSILEEFGWHGVALDIEYRHISDFIEENCDGVFLCYDNEIQFNGFAIIDDIEKVRSEVKTFIIDKINEKIKNEDIELDEEDAIEALEFFEIEVK